MNNPHPEPLGDGFCVYVTKTHHFSTDTVLLADFSMPAGAKKCADLGTGCGTIPLLWLKSNRNLTVDAVELQEEAYKLAKMSFEANGLEGKVNAVNSDLRNLRGVLPFGCYNLVACNPPYKSGGSGILNPDSQKTIARHESVCTLDDICKAASELLQFGGSFCLCQRPERLPDVTESMRKFGIEPKRIRLVQQRKSKPPKLFLIEGRRGGKRGYTEVMPTLFIEDENGGFSEEMLQIYGSYKEGHTETEEKP